MRSTNPCIPLAHSLPGIVLEPSPHPTPSLPGLVLGPSPQVINLVLEPSPHPTPSLPGDPPLRWSISCWQPGPRMPGTLPSSRGLTQRIAGRCSPGHS